MVFDYLGVKIRRTDLWTICREIRSAPGSGWRAPAPKSLSSYLSAAKSRMQRVPPDIQEFVLLSRRRIR
jgi:hypothetical protein